MAVKEGTFGGKDIIDSEDRNKIDPDVLEQSEPQNTRSLDLLSTALSDALGMPVGGYIMNQMFYIETVGARPQDFVFDRSYFELNLLVDFFQKPLNQLDEQTMTETIETKTALVRTLPKRPHYLAVIDGQMTVTEMQSLADRIKGVNKKK